MRELVIQMLIIIIKILCNISDKMSSSEDEAVGGEIIAKRHLRLLLKQCSDLTRKALDAENPDDTLVQDTIAEGNVYIPESYPNIKSFNSI